MMSSEIPLSLVDLCSQYIAKNIQRTLLKKVTNFTGTSSGSTSDESLHDDIILPVQVSEKLFNDLRSNLTTIKADDTDILEYFTNAKNRPLWNLELKQSNVTDTTLLKLLRNNGANLLTLDLSDCNKLTEAINSMVSDISVPKVHTLNLGNLLKIFHLWLGLSQIEIEERLSSTVLPSSNTTTETSEANASEQNENDAKKPNSIFSCLFPCWTFWFRPIRSPSLVLIDTIAQLSDSDSDSYSITPCLANNATKQNVKPIFTNIFENVRNFTIYGTSLDTLVLAEDVQVCIK